jgi:hypothetical protein
MISSKLIYLHLASQSSPIFVTLVHSAGTWTCVERHRAFSVSQYGCLVIYESHAISPEIQIVNRSLLIAHVNVEVEQVNRCERPPAQNLEKGWKPVPMKIWLRRGGVVIRHLARLCVLLDCV